MTKIIVAIAVTFTLVGWPLTAVHAQPNVTTNPAPAGDSLENTLERL